MRSLKRTEEEMSSLMMIRRIQNLRKRVSRSSHIVICLRELERVGFKILLWVGKEGIVGKVNA